MQQLTPVHYVCTCSCDGIHIVSVQITTTFYFTLVILAVVVFFHTKIMQLQSWIPIKQWQSGFSRPRTRPRLAKI